MVALRILTLVAGGLAVVATLLSAIRTVVLPRAEPAGLTRAVFLLVRRLFDLVVRRLPTYAQRDRLMALYAPISLLLLPLAWVTAVGLGFTAVNWGNGVEGWRAAFVLSGSSLLTLGFAAPGDIPDTLVSFLEAFIGLGLVALLIAYLPSIYAAFSRREREVSLLEVRAGDPPSAVVMLERYQRIRGLDQLMEIWITWEQWFAEIQESHTSQGSLAFFRSPQPTQSWVTAAGTVLDAAALMVSTVDGPPSPEAQLCIRSGFVALRRVADFFGIPHDHDPAPDDPITVSRAEWEAACDRLASEGIAIRVDRDQAWRDFAGWRVNYDAVLVGLATLTMAPDAPWTGDRAQVLRPAGPVRRVRSRWSR